MLKVVYTTTASAEGYFSQAVPDLPVWSGTVVQDFSLQPEVALTGLVNDNTTNTPITGAQMLVNTGAFTYTDTGSLYTLILLPGIYTATASADNYLPVTFTGIEVNSGTVTQDFSLHPGVFPRTSNP
jgi:hypothetical protein